MKQRLESKRDDFIKKYGDLDAFMFDGEIVPWLFKNGKPVKPEPFATNLDQFASDVDDGVGLMVVLFDMVLSVPKKDQKTGKLTKVSMTYDQRRQLLEDCFMTNGTLNQTSRYCM